MVFCENCGLENPDGMQVCQGCGASLATAAAPGAGAGPAAPTPAPGPAAPGPAAPGPALPSKTLALSSLLHEKYLILRELAAGGMGAVYMAQDTQLFNRQCVVKEMLPYYTTQQEKAEAESKFEREARLLANLRHPGIPQVYDYFIENNRYYLVMELVDGDDLEVKLARAGAPLPQDEVIKYATDVASVLVYISRQNPPVIHRDIKPANIIVDQNTSQAKLVDFGIAREEAPSGPVQSSVLGTPGYSPIEQYSHRTVPRSDVFSLGATLHHLLSGQDPRNAARLFEFQPLEQVAPGIRPDLAALVAQMLESDPTRRPTAEELQQRLQDMRQPTGPISVGAFTFRSGFVASDVMQLALECDRNWSDAAYHLYNGHFEPWLRGISRHDLAAKVEAIRLQGGNPNAGVEALIRALSPTSGLPVLHVLAPQLNLGTVEKGESAVGTIEIENSGRGYLNGEVQPLVQWVTIKPLEYGCMAGDRCVLEVEVDTDQLGEGPINQAICTLNSNGGQAQVSVDMQVTWQPKPVFSVPQVDLGQLMEAELGKQVQASFEITNGGGGLLEGRLECPAGWLLLNTNEFRLLSGQSATVNLVADTGQLALAHGQQAEITLTSTAGSVVLPARISVMKEAYAQRLPHWLVYGLLVLLGVAGWAAAATMGLQFAFGLGPNLGRAAIWVGVGVVVSVGAMLVSLGQTALLDEMENYYHAGDMAAELPTSEFSLNRVLLVGGATAAAGLLLGWAYLRSGGGWGGMLAGLVAGALLGVLLSLGGNAAIGMGLVRALLGGLAAACLGTLASVTWEPTPARMLVGWFTAFGTLLAADGVQGLALRLRWWLARLRPGLLSAFLAHLGYFAGMALFTRLVQPVFALYGTLPGFRPSVAGRSLVIVALSLGSAILGTWADSRAGADRRQGTRLFLWALLPGVVVAVLAFAVGRIVFGIVRIPVVWRWGVLATVLAAEVVVAWLASTRAQEVAQQAAKLKAKSATFTAKLKMPEFVSNAWPKLQARLPAPPAGGWLAALELTTLIAVVGATTVLAPLLTYVAVALLPWVILVVVILLVVGLTQG